jgi:hypothetical protein
VFAGGLTLFRPLGVVSEPGKNRGKRLQVTLTLNCRGAIRSAKKARMDFHLALCK